MGHAFYEFVPPEEYFDEHPEYFEMDEAGDRKRKEGQLCTTRPEVVEFVAAGVRRYFEENPTASYISPSPSDYLTWCRCEDCRRLDSGEVFRKAITRDTFRDFTVVSDGLWHFLNAVAERVASEFPDKKLYCFAYTRKTMWEQNPWPIARRLVRDIRYLRRNNFIGFFSQGGEQAWGQLGVNYYLMAKALWDPGCDVEAILDDYFRHTFGPASASMKRYYDTMEEAVSLCDENASKDALDLWLADREKWGIRDKYLRTWESELA